MVELKKHNLTLENRKELHVMGVKHVGSYDEKEICLETVIGGLILKGEGLSVKQLDLENGEMVVTGESFNAFAYGNVEGKGKGIWQKLWK